MSRVTDPDRLNQTASVHDLCERITDHGACEMLAITFDADGAYAYWQSASVDRARMVLALAEMFHEMMHGDEEGFEC